MKYEVDYSAVPNSHWTQWLEEDHFLFLRSHEFWEHPAVSKLAQKMRPSEWEIDCDSDVIMMEFLSDYWVDDILSRESEVNEELYYKAKEYAHIKDFQVLQHPAVLEQFTSMREAQGKEYDLEKSGMSDALTELMKDIPVDEWKETDFEMLVKDPYMRRLAKEIIVLIVESGYAPIRDHVNNILTDKYKNSDDEDDRNVYEVFLSNDKYTFRESMSAIDYRLDYNERPYWLMIILYPAENLPSYLHDQMLYMNYIQYIVRHDEKEEKEIVLNESLLGDTPNLEDFKIAVQNLGRYWT